VNAFVQGTVCLLFAAAADYLAVCEHFHTVFMENVPILKADQRNEIRRLILLVDELYQHKVKRCMPMVMMCTLHCIGLQLDCSRFLRALSCRNSMRPNTQIRLVVSAAAPADQLLKVGEDTMHDEVTSSHDNRRSRSR